MMSTTRLPFNISGITTYQTTGNGPAMLLVHGVGMNSHYWNNIKNHLTKHFSVTVVDIPGHGCSPCLDSNNPALSDYTDVIAATVDQPTIIVGHSMGALIALDLSVRYPDKTTGIAVLNGIYRRDHAASKAVLQRAALLNANTSPDPTDTLLRWFGDRPTGTYAIAADNCRKWLTEVDPAGYRSAYLAFAQSDAPTDAQLAGIACPALFITGSDEPNSTPAMSKKMSELLSNAKYISIEGARHMMSLTHGAETTRALINFFITSESKIA